MASYFSKYRISLLAISDTLQGTIASEEKHGKSEKNVSPKRILLTNGDGHAARQLASILTYKGHFVYVLRSPGDLDDAYEWGGDVCGLWEIYPDKPYQKDEHQAPTWLSVIIRAIKEYRINIVIPMQDEMAALAVGIDRLLSTGVHIAIAPFGTLRKVMDKTTAVNTLSKLGVKQPRFKTLFSNAEYDDEFWVLFSRPDDWFPLMVKEKYSINGRGVRKLSSPSEYVSFGLSLKQRGHFRNDGHQHVLLQKWIPGTFIRVQGVFDHGALKSWHAYAGILQDMDLRITPQKESRCREAYRDHMISVGYGLS